MSYYRYEAYQGTIKGGHRVPLVRTIREISTVALIGLHKDLFDLGSMGVLWGV